MSQPEPTPHQEPDPRALAAWYLNDRHRLLWNVPLIAIGLLVILVFALAGAAADRKADAPETLARLHALEPAPVPDAENAATDYVLAWEARNKDAISAFYKHIGKGSPAFGSGSGSEGEEALQYLDSYVESRQHLFAAVEKESANWHLDYVDGLQVKLPHLSQMRELARGLSVYARRCAKNKDHLEAAHALGGIYRMSRHLETEPFAICYLVSVSLQAIADRTLEGILYFDTPRTLVGVEAYQKALRRDRASKPKSLRVLQGELVAFERMADQLAAGEVNLDEIGQGKPPSDRTRLLTWEAFEPLWYGPEKAAGRDGYTLLMAAVEDGEILDETFIDRYLTRPALGTRVLEGVTLPVLVGVNEALRRAEAEGQGVELALALLSYRARNSRYPATLNDLVPGELPALPAEPWRGGAWQMRVVPQGWKEPDYTQGRLRTFGTKHLRVYSFGHNGEDDGGRCFWIDPEEEQHAERADDPAVMLPLDPADKP